VSVVRSPFTGPRVAGLARRARLRRRWLALAAAVAVIAGVVVAVSGPFSSGSGGGVPDSGSATSLSTVVRRSLSAQTLVDGTLGYVGSSSVVVAAGTTQADLRQAQQTFASARATLAGANATLADDRSEVARARATLEAARLKQAGDCRGANAAGGGSDGGSGEGGDGGSGSSPCSSAAQAVATADEAVRTAEQKVVTDRGSVASARAALSGAEASLAAAESSSTGYEATAAYTMLPSAGTLVRRGQTLYAVDGQPVLLLYGRTTPWRSFRPGMSPGRDIAVLNANLRALGYGSRPAGNTFSTATRQAIAALQARRGLRPTGVLRLGSVVFKPGAVRVTSVTPTVGQTAQAGALMTVTSTRHAVTIELDAAQQDAVEVGDPVTITLPSGRTTPGRLSFVGSVASTPSEGDSGDSGDSDTPTIDVTVRLLRQADAGKLDQAPVSVAITTASVKNVLVVPVASLLALAGGGYAVEAVNAAGIHRLIPVELGLFDDSNGLVEARGAGLRAGERVVVPAS
jgi:Putative peptidoglycan binding domain